MSEAEHWNLADLESRLSSAAQKQYPNAMSSLLREAQSALSMMRRTNTELHRRTQEAEAPIQSAVSKAKYAEEHLRGWAKSSFDRLLHAHDEVKRIYEHLRRARPDGCDNYGYHSVNDMRFDGGPSDAGAVWVNKYISRLGGIVTVRPAEIVGPIIDELLQLRKSRERG